MRGAHFYLLFFFVIQKSTRRQEKSVRRAALHITYATVPGPGETLLIGQ